MDSQLLKKSENHPATGRNKKNKKGGKSEFVQIHSPNSALEPHCTHKKQMKRVNQKPDWRATVSPHGRSFALREGWRGAVGTCSGGTN